MHHAQAFLDGLTRLDGDCLVELGTVIRLARGPARLYAWAGKSSRRTTVANAVAVDAAGATFLGATNKGGPAQDESAAVPWSIVRALAVATGNWAESREEWVRVALRQGRMFRLAPHGSATVAQEPASWFRAWPSAGASPTRIKSVPRALEVAGEVGPGVAIDLELLANGEGIRLRQHLLLGVEYQLPDGWRLRAERERAVLSHGSGAVLELSSGDERFVDAVASLDATSHRAHEEPTCPGS